MKSPLASLLCVLMTTASVLAQPSAPAAAAPRSAATAATTPTTTTAPAAPRQDPTVPAIKYAKDGITPNPGFMKNHEKFLARAKEGNVDLLFIGDSITAGWGSNGKEIWKERYESRNAANFGIGGDRTQHVLWRIENGELEGIKPKVIVVMIGTNNTNTDEPDRIAEGVMKIVKMAQAKTGAKVLLLAVFPRGESEEAGVKWRGKIAKINETIAKLDDGKTVRYLDLKDAFQQPDGTIPKEVMYDALHLTPAGYKVWADAMEPLLAEMLGQ